MTDDEALAILADPEGHTLQEIQEAQILTIRRTDNAAGPDEGEQPEQPQGPRP